MASIRWMRPAERAAFRLPQRTKDDLTRTVSSLGRFPEMGMAVPGSRQRGHRQIPLHGGYTLFYTYNRSHDVCVLSSIRSARRR